MRRARVPRAAHSAGVVALLLGCASEQYVEPEDRADPEGLDGPSGLAGTTSNAAGQTQAASSGGKSGSMTGSGGRAGSTSNFHAGSGGSEDHGGSSGSSSGGSAGSGGVSGAAGSSGSAGQAGMPNQPNMCDEATATLLGSMQSNVTVASNACLKMNVPADQTWIKKITMQPEGGMYPLPFTWSNCGTNSSGAFTANYGNQILNPVTSECPVLVKLGGSGSPLNVQWWGG